MNRIKELRTARNMKQVELARKLNVSQAALSGYETGKYEPDNETIKKIARIFNTSVDYLLGGDASAAAYQNGNGARIKVFAKIPAGIPIEALEDVVDFEDISPTC
jgi:repressor LexA